MAGFAQQVIILTGASRGIGQALALELAAHQPRLVLAARDGAALELVAAQCRQAGAETLVVPTDVTEEGQCRALVDLAVKRFGRLDTLVNNAGAAMWSRFDKLEDLAVLESIMRLNYLGSVYPTFYALPHLKQSRGLIVALSSLSGLVGAPMLSGYAASKHAVIGFFETLRIELAASGVDVTIVAPDFVRSEIIARSLDSHGKPLGRNPSNMDRALSAEKCARIIARGMARRKRLVLTSSRSAYARWGQLLIPGLVDRIAAATMRQR